MTLYIYAITRADESDTHLPPGVAGEKVYPILSGPLRAFVSDYSGTTIRAERRHIAASQGVLRALQGDLDLLPMVFGVLTPAADAVADLLTRHCDSFLAQLDRIKGSVEMGVRLNLEAPDPIAFVVEHTTELRQARDRTFGRRRVPSQQDRIRLGQLCEAALHRFQEAQAALLIERLSPACLAISTLPVQGDRQVANLAVLVPRTGVAAFEAAVHAAAETFDDNLAFNLNGPWPPHNFVQLKLES
jgi:Gas vesicle synthesis protein GvpL/GvpF